MNYQLIKKIVEMECDIDDIGIKSRKAYIRDCRNTYCKLSLKFVKKFNLGKCGKEINRDHTTIINSLKKFKVDYGTDAFLANKIYDNCNDKLVYLSTQNTETRDLAIVKDVKQYYLLKHLMLVEQTQKVIKKLQNRIVEINKNNK